MRRKTGAKSDRPRRNHRLLAAAIALIALLAIIACGSAATPIPTATPAPTPAPTATPAPAVTPTATAIPTAAAPSPTPANTPAPQPTATPEATPTPTSTPTPAPEPTATATVAPAPAKPEPTATPPPPATPTPEPDIPPPPCQGNRGGQVGDCAPEFAGTQEWINSQPLTMQELRGKVVLIDFWTYSCINCIRTLPYLQSWHTRYAADGLVIVGVHTPEFEFEKLYDNVTQAALDEGVTWPVVQDNARAVWSSYANRYWPAKYLIDRHGVIRYRHFGEGKYAETEEEIRKLLQEAGAASAALTMPLPSDQQIDDAYIDSGRRRTPELFAGWRFVLSHYLAGRGTYVGQIDAYNTRRDQVAQLQPPESITPNRIYFNGPWHLGAERARHAEQTDHLDDFALLVYSARSVNAVLTSESGQPYKVVVTVDNEYLTADNKGDDIIIAANGESYLMVTEPKAYKIIEHPEWQENRILQMFSMSDDFGLYSFTFGTYKDGF